jgi:hypothetical protein
LGPAERHKVWSDSLTKPRQSFSLAILTREAQTAGAESLLSCRSATRRVPYRFRETIRVKPEETANTRCQANRGRAASGQRSLGVANSLHRMSTGNWERRTLSKMTTRWSTNNCSATSSCRSRVIALPVPHSSCSSWEMCTFRVAMRCRASAISRLVLARRLYQVLRSIAEFNFPHAARRFGCSAGL